MFFYIGTVILHMSPKRFWKTTPRTFKALIDVHVELNDPEGKKGSSRAKPQKAYIDQVLF